MAVALICATVALAVPHDAWLPFSPVPAGAADWERVPGWPMSALADLQVGFGRRLWPTAPVHGGIAVAAALASMVTALLAVALRATALPPTLATLLALVAVAAPLGGWQASSPLAAGSASLASACLLWAVVWPSTRPRPRLSAIGLGLRMPTRGRQACAVVVLILVAEAVARHRPATAVLDTLRLVHGDLGLPGLVLLAAALGRVGGALSSPTRVWLGLGVVWLVTVPFAGEARAAALLPWVWWLAGAGLAEVLAWRGAQAARCAAAGLAIWVSLHAARTPWSHQHQQAALTRTWADTLVARVDASHPLVDTPSAQGALLTALARHRATGTSPPAVVDLDEAAAAVQDGRQVVVASAPDFETLRWSGVAFDAWPDGTGMPIEGVLRVLPRGIVVLAAVSVEAASSITPAQWQALGRVGLRLADAGTPRAHALVGITGARAEAIEAARAGSVRLDVQPGDPLGRTGARSPIDARLDAGASHVSITWRGRPFIADEPGMVLMFLSTRGDLLGWRSGRTGDHLDGPALGQVPATRAVALAALPCLDLGGGEVPVDVTGLAGSGALGITWRSAGRLEVALTRPTGSRAQPVRLAGDASGVGAPVLHESGTPPSAFTLAAPGPTAAGVYLRGPVAEARAVSTVPVRLCAAWPMPHAVDPGRAPVEMGVSPRHEPHFGVGWHDAEVQAGGGYFRWMAGARAEILLALRAPTPFALAIDVQPPEVPAAGDEVRLSVNGQDLGPRPLLATRGVYTWDVSASAVRPGVNTFALTTTRTVRPSDRQPGGDARTLGLMVHGWTLAPTAAPTSVPAR